MKLRFILPAMSVGLSLCGCVAERPGFTLDAVGPLPEASPHPEVLQGTLTVFSAYDVHAHFLSDSYDGREYSDYKILGLDGKLFRKVHNVPPSGLEEPVSVILPAGNFVVVAQANGYGTVRVPVVIKPHRSTVLHLESDGNWGREPGFNSNNAVRLPDGCIIGYRNSAEESRALKRPEGVAALK